MRNADGLRLTRFCKVAYAIPSSSAASSSVIYTSGTSVPPFCCYAAIAFSTLFGSRLRVATISGRYFSPERTP